MANNEVGFKIDNNIEISKLDVPFQMLYDSMHIEIFGRRKIIFEGGYRIVEYTNEIIRIKNKKSTIVFSGNGLSIGNIQRDSFMISGTFNGISFE